MGQEVVDKVQAIELQLYTYRESLTDLQAQLDQARVAPTVEEFESLAAIIQDTLDIAGYGSFETFQIVYNLAGLDDSQLVDWSEHMRAEYDLTDALE